MGLGPSLLHTWAFPLGLLTGLWGFRILSKKDSEEDCHPRKDNTSQRVGGSLSFGVHCLAFPFTSFLCLECQNLFVLDWRRFRDFLWGGGNLERKPHLVNWKTVCLEKSRGGLGVRSLSKMNKALFCKWCWRFANERDSLWRLVISTKFGEEDGG